MTAEPRATPHFAIAIGAGIASGACVAVQGRLNADLAAAGAGAMPASWYSYLGTLVFLAVMALGVGRLPALVRTLRQRGRWWWYVIGFCGVPIVISTTYGVAVVGVALAAVCSLAGQTVSGMVLDSRGIGVPVSIRFSARRVGGAVCAVAGLGVVVVAAPMPEGVSALLGGLTALALFAGGFVLAGQQAGNGVVMGVTRDPIVPAFASCFGGFVLISVILGGLGLAGQLGPIAWPGVEKWWLYLGGPLGALVTAAAAYAVRHVGTLVLTFAVVGGQMTAAIALDLITGVGASWATAVAVAAIAIAIVLAARRPQRARPAVDTPLARDEPTP